VNPNPAPSTPVAPDLNQLAYLKAMAESAKASGNAAKLPGYSAMADKIYATMTPEMEKMVRGMNADALNAYRKGGTGGGGAPPGDGQQPPPEEKEQPAPNDAYLQALMEMMNQQGKQRDDETSQFLQMFMEMANQQNQNQMPKWMEEWAKMQAEAQANAERGNVQQLIDSLNSDQRFELENIQNNLSQGKQAVEDRTFQNWLQSRQDIANRGLGGSGIASDQDTRLMLAQGRDLNNLFSQANTQLGEIGRRYGSKLSQAYDNLSKINPALMQSSLMQNLFKENSANMTERMKMISDLIGDFLPYNRVQPLDLLKLSQEDRQFYDKLSSEEQREYAKLGSNERVEFAKLGSAERQLYAKLDQEDRQFYAKLDQDDRQFFSKLNQDGSLKLTEIMGVDAQGNPTLDMLKLNEAIRNNDLQVQFDYDKLTAQVQKWASDKEYDLKKLSQDDVQFYDKLHAQQSKDQAMLDQASAAAQTSRDKAILDGLKAKLTSVDSQIREFARNNKKKPIDPQLLGQRESIMDSIDRLITGGMGNSNKSEGGVVGLGGLSKKYESNGNPGTIANNTGDPGGASYGSYQIATKTGTMQSFLSWASSNAPQVASALAGKQPGTAAFDTAWKSLASSNPQMFEQAQHNFIQASHYQPVANAVKNMGLDVNKRSQAVRDVVWSTAVQHGVGGAQSVIKAAIGNNPNISDEELIRKIYAERGANDGKKYFSSSSDSIRQSVVNRFRNELQDALKML